MLKRHGGCLRAASQLITSPGCVQSIQGRRRASTYASILLCNGSRKSTIRKSQFLHQSSAFIFQNRTLREKYLSPAPAAAIRESSSKSASSSILIYAVLSIGGLFLLYVTASINPLQLDNGIEDSAYWTDLEKLFKQYKPEPTVTCSQADGMLEWNVVSRTYRGIGDILRYDAVNVPCSSDGGEDRVAAYRWEDYDILMAAIFDGHVGSKTAAAVQEYLVFYIMRHIKAISPPNQFGRVESSAGDKAIKKAFIELDQDIMKTAELALHSTEASAVTALETAFSGSCALVSLYDGRTKMLKTACTGDSRTVLGRFSKMTGRWEAILLSEDQTGYNNSEILRLQQEHPNEPEMIKDGRLLGLGVTRAFGDSRWKWPRRLQEFARERFFGPPLRQGMMTPPYLTAEPEITTTQIHPENGDFIIQASDGLWDQMTSAQAVSLIGKWLEGHDPSKGAAPTLSREALLATLRQPEPETDSPRGDKFSFRDRVKEDDWIVKDENAAAHLVRNALGGRNYNRLCAMAPQIVVRSDNPLALGERMRLYLCLDVEDGVLIIKFTTGLFSAGPPFSRDMRDDISVQVVFFNEDSNAIINT